MAWRVYIYIGVRERGPERAALLRVQLRRVHRVRHQRAAASARRPDGDHDRRPMLLLRPSALAGTLEGVLRRLLHPLLDHVRDRGAVPSCWFGPERVPHQVHQQPPRGPAVLRDAAQGRVRRRRRLHLPHGALLRAALRLLRQGTRRRLHAAAHRRRHRHDPHALVHFSFLPVAADYLLPPQLLHCLPLQHECMTDH